MKPSAVLRAVHRGIRPVTPGGVSLGLGHGRERRGTDARRRRGTGTERGTAWRAAGDLRGRGVHAVRAALLLWMGVRATQGEPGRARRRAAPGRRPRGPLRRRLLLLGIWCFMVVRTLRRDPEPELPPRRSGSPGGRKGWSRGLPFEWPLRALAPFDTGAGCTVTLPQRRQCHRIVPLPRAAVRTLPVRTQ